MAVQVRHLCQGYLSADKECTIRIRIADNNAYITIKGSNPKDSIEHFEWEKEINIDEAKTLMSLCRTGIIDKERYIVPFEGLTIEVDVFHGSNEGLILAEIELPTAVYNLPTLPDFIGNEVTFDHRYYNSYLSLHPYTEWG